MKINDITTGADLREFIEENGWTAEQIADGLGFDVLSVKRWLDRTEDWFGGTERRSTLLRLAVRGVMAEGEKLTAPDDAPPMKIELLVYPNDRIEVGKTRMAKARRKRGTGQRAGMDFISIP